MTMRVVYLKDHDGHKANKDYFIERTLGRRLCDNGITVPYTTHMEALRKAEEAGRKAAVEAEKKAKKEAEEKAEAEKLLKEKEDQAKETADSKPAKSRSKSIKK